MTSWSGWASEVDITPFVAHMNPDGGGDLPEAEKTAVAKLISTQTCADDTMVICYTDAFPHSDFSESLPKHIEAEKAFLGANFDWIKLCGLLNAPMFFLIPRVSARLVANFAAVASHLTGGICLEMSYIRADDIVKTTVNLILLISGMKVVFPPDIVRVTVASAVTFQDKESVIPGVVIKRDASIEYVSNRASGEDLISRFYEDQVYADKVYGAFEVLAASASICAINANPLFGQFWR